ncbi:MAG: thiamine pyrophosphate-dependent enzyme [Candidatus Bathyarchaeia archaeon]
MRASDLKTYAKNTWCPGCGNFAIELAARQAFVELMEGGKLRIENLVVLSGIGCHAKMSDYLRVNSFYSLHGRVVAPATGVKLANPELTVVGFAGDGDAYGEGLEHLVFAAKRNVGISMIIHDNGVYGLTTGQFTPTSPPGFPGKSTPRGSPEDPINPIALMLSSGATFVARAFPGNLQHLRSMIREAISHRGFSIVDVLQPCVTFRDTWDFFSKRVYDLQERGHDSSNWEEAMDRAREWDYGGGAERIPIGIFYKAERPTFEERVLGGRRPRGLPMPNLERILKDHI